MVAPDPVARGGALLGRGALDRGHRAVPVALHRVRLGRSREQLVGACEEGEEQPLRIDPLLGNELPGWLAQHLFGLGSLRGPTRPRRVT